MLDSESDGVLGVSTQGNSIGRPQVLGRWIVDDAENNSGKYVSAVLDWVYWRSKLQDFVTMAGPTHNLSPGSEPSDYLALQSNLNLGLHWKKKVTAVQNSELGSS